MGKDIFSSHVLEIFRPMLAAVRLDYRQRSVGLSSALRLCEPRFRPVATAHLPVSDDLNQRYVVVAISL